MNSIVQVAIPCPLRQTFDYLSDQNTSAWQPGMRVKVEFRTKVVTGIVISASPVTADTNLKKLKSIETVLDSTPLLSDELMQIIVWISQYYHHPIGECFQTALPKKLRQGEPAELIMEHWWYRTEKEINQKLGAKQQLCLDSLNDDPDGIGQSKLTQLLGNVTSSLKSLQTKQLIDFVEKPRLPVSGIELSPQISLSQEQSGAVETIWKQRQTFSPYLLQGVTGSGKTEVYIALAQKMIAAGKQVLILIPEIGLTSQFVTRFKQKIEGTIVVLNSSISDTERKQGWLLAKQHLADVIIGTRSAIFTPLSDAGLIILDEEHDASYKQQDGLKYHARNVALVRAQKNGIPIVLGTATPSLETLYQVQQQKYQLLELTQRAGTAVLPAVHLVDTSQNNADQNISATLIKAIEKHVESGNQVILFINRRGFAPVLMCHECGWQASCAHCDAKMVIHQQKNILFCHHCGYIIKRIETCPECQNDDLKTYGAGTEKIEHTLQQQFPHVPVIRVDRDSTQRINAFTNLIEELKRGEPQILVGTQMLAKGHDFHDVTLVGVLDADQGLYSADYRATENLAQLITQVTGRAGRGDKKGEVLIQTDQPQHTFWQTLIKQGYQETANALLKQRVEMQIPPASFWGVIRAEHPQRELTDQLLVAFSTILQQQSLPVQVLGPVPALMERKAGRFRSQLLLISQQRKHLHQLLDHFLMQTQSIPLSRKVRWSIDIDPIDLL